MKLLTTVCISLLAIASNSFFVLGSAPVPDVQQSFSFEIFQNFREPKNIMFSAMYGGSSHVVWVISILDELASRGHSTFYLTRDDQVKFAKDYPMVKTFSIGPQIDKKIRQQSIRDLREKPVVQGMKALLSRMTEKFEEDYIASRDFIDSNDIDIAICDHFNSACVEAARTANIPFIITSSFPQGQDVKVPYINSDMFNMRNPTTEFMSLKDRINDMIIKPIEMMVALKDNMHRQKQIFISLGLEPPTQPLTARWTDSIKLFNTAFGFDQGRPIGPLVELVGPILPKKFAALTPNLASFLDSHKRVAYIAFGQHAMPTESDGHMVMTALLEALEANDMDGIIWATRGMKEVFPAYVTTQSNTTYDIQSFYDETSQGHVLFTDWAPQMAILSHPSTSFFVTHGGAGSLHESFYAGVRVVVFPFFGDQPGAARTAEKNGVGLFLDYKKSQQNANEIVRRVARDENGEFQANANRFKALVQIRSIRGPARSADIVEEVLFMQKDTKIPHRWDVKRNMSYIKANNLDIYAFLLTFTACVLYGTYGIFSYLTTSVKSHYNKLKTL